MTLFLLILLDISYFKDIPRGTVMKEGDVRFSPILVSSALPGQNKNRIGFGLGFGLIRIQIRLGLDRMRVIIGLRIGFGLGIGLGLGSD